MARDPIISRDVRMAKKNILNPPKKPAKKGPEKDLEEANKKLEDIRKIIKKWIFVGRYGWSPAEQTQSDIEN